MKFKDILLMCLRNLTKRKARTFLTVSGVTIGTCAIIVMISLGVGMTQAQEAMMSEWADLTLVEVYRRGDVDAQGNKVPELDDAMLEQFMGWEGVRAVTPFYSNLYSGNGMAIYSGDYMIQCQIVGVYMDQLEAFGYKLSEGRYYQKGDQYTDVIVGSNAFSSLYNYVDEEYIYEPSPAELEQYKKWAEESGMTLEQMLGSSYDPDAESAVNIEENGLFIIPLAMDPDTWQNDYSVINSPSAPQKEYESELNIIGKIIGNDRDYYTQNGIFFDIKYMNTLIEAYQEFNSDMNWGIEKITSYDSVKIRVNEIDDVATIQDELEKLGYGSYSDTQSQENMKSQLLMIQAVLGGLAAISLFVAALNITNTMIMSIYERTKEIGIMKVLGCDVSNIRVLFLTEAAAIGLIGGITGTLLSYGISVVLNNVLIEQITSLLGGSLQEGMKISVIPIWLVGLAIAFATIVGVVSGFYPANRSVKISALSAIRNE